MNPALIKQYRFTLSDFKDRTGRVIKVWATTITKGEKTCRVIIDCALGWNPKIVHQEIREALESISK